MTSSVPPPAGRLRPQHPIRSATIAVATVFLLAGVLGFIPLSTTGLDGLSFAGPDSTAMLFELFQVSVLHNLVHLAFGVLGFALAGTVPRATAFLGVGGAAYLALWVYGLIVEQQSAANFVPVNGPDNWLHLGLGAGMLGLTVVLRRLGPMSGEQPPAGPGPAR